MEQLIKEIEELINRRIVKDQCYCEHCLKFKDAGWKCNNCGYFGIPNTEHCTCFEIPTCGGFGAYDIRKGCNHGNILCPVCKNNHKENAWKFLKGIREIVAKYKKPETEVKINLIAPDPEQ